ncbi:MULTISPECIES: hypothetical protein [Helicobacter]|nr:MULTISPECIES: hypothetical protein [Helicobacter]
MLTLLFLQVWVKSLRIARDFEKVEKSSFYVSRDVTLSLNTTS